MKNLIPVERIEKAILLIRGHKVMLDSILAELYHVPTKSLNLAVKRNLSRFPEDFMFQLTDEEFEILRFQIETSKGSGGRRYAPYVFTEQGVAMLSSVLGSDRAIKVNIEIMRAFVRLRHLIASNKDLAKRMNDLETRCNDHDIQIETVFDTLDALMAPSPGRNRKIGFGRGGSG